MHVIVTQKANQEKMLSSLDVKDELRDSAEDKVHRQTQCTIMVLQLALLVGPAANDIKKENIPTKNMVGHKFLFETILEVHLGGKPMKISQQTTTTTVISLLFPGRIQFVLFDN